MNAEEIIAVVNPAPRLDVIKRVKAINWALLIVSSAFLITAGSKVLHFQSSKVKILPLLLLSAMLVPLNIYGVWTEVQHDNHATKANSGLKSTTIASIAVTVITTVTMFSLWCEHRSGAQVTRVSFIVLLMNLALAAIVWTKSAMNLST